MNQVNLLPIEYRLRRKQNLIVRRAVIGISCVAIVGIVVLGMQRIQLSRLRFEKERVRQAMTSHDHMLATITAEKEKRQALELRASIILNALDAPQWGQVLYEVSTVTPDGIWLEALAFTPQPKPAEPESGSGVREYGEIRFQGGGSDPQAVSRFMQSLTTSERFRSVTPVNTETPGPGKPASFTIVGRLIY